MAKKAGTSLGLSIFLIIGLLVILTAGSAVAVTFFGRTLTRDAITTDLRRTHSAQALLQQKRYGQLELGAAVVKRDKWVADFLASGSGDADFLATQADEYLDRQGALDLLVILDRDGKVVFQRGADGLLEPGQDFSGDPLFQAAGQKESASGLWTLGQQAPHHAVFAQLKRDFELQGHVVLASSIVPMAEEIKRTSGAEVVFFADSPTGPSVVTSTLDSAGADAVIEALRREGQGLPRVKRGETVQGVGLTLGEKPWLAFLTPLRDAAETPVGATVALIEVSQKLAVYQQMQLLLAAVAGGALLLGLLLALGLGRRVLGPVNKLAAATQEVAGGNYELDLPKAKGHFAPLISPLGQLTRRLRDRQSLETFLDSVARTLPEPAKTQTATPPAARQLTLVAIEMRRFANPKLGYDPEENVGRFARDLRRMSDAILSQQGSVDAVFGHRVLGVFEGEKATLRALAAATEILLILTTRENAFDEPAPPVVALTQGSVVTGTVRWGARTDMAVAGLPVQQLESLLREATPGEIYFSKPIAEELAGPCKQAGVEMRAQRGLMSPQPLYLLSPEAAQRFTGVQPPESGERAATQALTVADLVPGELLGGRFEIQSELGRGPLGTVFKTLDRDRGDLVKLKVLKGEVLADGARLERLKQSLEQARMISHPNIAGVLDFGQAASLAYITSPFARGMTLRYVLDQSSEMPLRPAFLLAQRIAQGLGAAHRQKLAHGGLKPENVLIEPAGGVKLMDFGHGPPVAPVAPDAPFAGAPYLAPEQLAGQPLGPRADIYAWGAVFFEMVTGQVQFAGTTMNEVGAGRQAEVPELPSALRPDLPPQLEALILRCLEADPNGRFASIDELLGEIDALRS